MDSEYAFNSSIEKSLKSVPAFNISKPYVSTSISAIFANFFPISTSSFVQVGDLNNNVKI